MNSGQEIEIELRHEDEILSYRGHRVAPATSRALNPSFDVTSAHLISGIICETGLVLDPTTRTMRTLLEKKDV
jgi:methylthioribose-1-phosphate isomerase